MRTPERAKATIALPGPCPFASQPRRPARGFTLIEVMIAVAVVAILSMIAYPSYTDYLRRGQVQEAPRNLADFRTKMEQYYQDNRSYAAGAACGVPVPVAPGAKYFSYACAVASAGQAYIATATGVGGSVAGLAYTVDQLNNQGSTCNSCAWSFASPQTTWVLRKP